MPRKLKTKDFIERAMNVHNGFYNYSLVDYKGVYQKIIIICPIHGEFGQTPSNHLSGTGYPE